MSNNDPFIIRINKNKNSRQNDGSIYHEIVLNNGKRIYVDPENHNYKDAWDILIENDKESIGLRLPGLKLKKSHCYDADVFPVGAYFDEAPATTLDNLTE
jgi:hypothetical protein|tara:strand:+ start:1069 stop:1368 length:300 start_codon:yes stop_codon:yes gene_type:complete